MRYSKQRDIILQTLTDNPIHPTAEQLYALVKQIAPAISLATVYRNLNQLAENGVIKKICGLDGTSHFDHNIHNHYHLLCSKCHKVYDVPYDIAPRLSEEVLSQTGMIVESCDIAMRGICNNCKTKN